MAWFIGFGKKRVYFPEKKKKTQWGKVWKASIRDSFLKVKIYIPSASGMNDTTQQKMDM